MEIDVTKSNKNSVLHALQSDHLWFSNILCLFEFVSFICMVTNVALCEDGPKSLSLSLNKM